MLNLILCWELFKLLEFINELSVKLVVPQKPCLLKCMPFLVPSP